ncbi:MAG TPA: respiratory nitrate reductase subunit gamma [Planctomycetota bacterium]
MNDFFWFAILPYVAVVLFLVVTIQRYRQRKYTYSSLSSQFLENKSHFWGSVPFHYGILTVLAIHLLALLLPRGVLAWNRVPLRLAILEVTGLAFAVLTLVGLVNLLARRLGDRLTRRVTTMGDWVVFLLLFVQVISGIGVALFHAWGSSWFATSASPWLWSLATLAPDVSLVAGLPWLVKLHVICAFVLIAVFPFTRLVHVLVLPNPYLWRKTQVVRWNWDRETIRTGKRAPR